MKTKQTPPRNPSDVVQSTFGYQAELLPSLRYEPNLYYEDNALNLYVSISSDMVQSSPTSSATEDAATTLPSRKLLFLSSNAGREPDRHSVQKRRLPKDEIPSVPEAWQGKSANIIVVNVLKPFTTNNDSLKRPLLVIDGKQKDFYKPRQQELPRREFLK